MPPLFWLDVAALIVTTIVMTSLGLLVLGTDPRRALNRSFALFTLMGGGWAISALLLRLSLWLNPLLPAGLRIGTSLIWLELTGLLIGLMTNYAQRFTVLYLGRRTRWTNLILNLGLLLALAFSIPLFRHQLVFNPRLSGSGMVVEDMTGWGMAVAAIVIAYLAWSLALFWQERRSIGEPAMAFGVLMLLVGVTLGGILDVSAPVMSISNALAAALLAHATISRQLFNPLRERTAALQREVAERKQAEETLQLTQFSVDHAADAAYWIGSDGRLLYVNKVACRSLGYPCERLLSMTIHEIDPHVEKERWSDYWGEIKRQGSRTMESHHRARDGRIFPVEVTCNYLQFGGKEYCFAFARDITGRKQAEDEQRRLLLQVREQAQQLQRIMEIVPEGVLVLNTDRQVVLANPLGQEYATVLADAHEGDVLSRLGDRSLDTLLTSPPMGLWHDVTAADRSFVVIARSMDTGPQTAGWVLVIRDVTQERKIRQQVQQQERLAAVGQLAAGIAHDFNNTMAVITLYSQMAQRSPDLSPRTAQYLETVEEQAKRAGKLIQQILDFSRQSTLELRSLNLVPLLKEQVKLLKRILPENIRITLAHGPEDFTLSADPTRIQQVIMNLAVNARDAMPDGGDLRIGLERIVVRDGEGAPQHKLNAGEWFQLTVSDTGTGIPEDQLGHIFEPFFTTKEKGQGTGLGLAQVFGIVQQHEGHIHVSSRVGEGTTFTLLLPALPRLEPEVLAGEDGLLIPGQGQIVLVVEDEAAVRQAVVACLEALNYRPLEAANGQEALAVYERRITSGQRVELVLSDLVMPVMGGEALLHALRERDPAVKLAVLTGHLMPHEIQRLESAGVAGCLHKPPDLAQLARVVDQILREVH